MDELLLEKIQKSVVDLLLSFSDNLQIAAKDQCSEMARLVGCWILNESSDYKIQICKGMLPSGSTHDVMIVGKEDSLSLIDPTVWQIFPESKSIFIGSSRDLPSAIGLLEEKYGGEWKLSEAVTECSESHRQGLLETIKKSGGEIGNASD